MALSFFACFGMKFLLYALKHLFDDTQNDFS